MKDSVSKTTLAKRAGSVAQVLEYWPSNCKALSSNPTTTKKVKIKKLFRTQNACV
jgi:hypothetical protein